MVRMVLWNSTIFVISISFNSFDSECYYEAFEQNPRMDAERVRIYVLYITNTTTIYFLVNFVGGTGNFLTALNPFTFLW